MHDQTRATLALACMWIHMAGRLPVRKGSSGTWGDTTRVLCARLACMHADPVSHQLSLTHTRHAAGTHPRTGSARRNGRSIRPSAGTNVYLAPRPAAQAAGMHAAIYILAASSPAYRWSEDGVARPPGRGLAAHAASRGAHDRASTRTARTLSACVIARGVRTGARVFLSLVLHRSVTRADRPGNNEWRVC